MVKISRKSGTSASISSPFFSRYFSRGSRKLLGNSKNKVPKVQFVISDRLIGLHDTFYFPKKCFPKKKKTYIRKINNSLTRNPLRIKTRITIFYNIKIVPTHTYITVIFFFVAYTETHFLSTNS